MATRMYNVKHPQRKKAVWLGQSANGATGKTHAQSMWQMEFTMTSNFLVETLVLTYGLSSHSIALRKVRIKQFYLYTAMLKGPCI